MSKRVEIVIPLSLVLVWTQVRVEVVGGRRPTAQIEESKASTAAIRASRWGCSVVVVRWWLRGGGQLKQTEKEVGWAGRCATRSAWRRRRWRTVAASCHFGSEARARRHLRRVRWRRWACVGLLKDILTLI